MEAVRKPPSGGRARRDEVNQGSERTVKISKLIYKTICNNKDNDNNNHSLCKSESRRQS